MGLGYVCPAKYLESDSYGQNIDFKELSGRVSSSADAINIFAKCLLLVKGNLWVFVPLWENLSHPLLRK
jgi:hypothetical protein